MLVSVTSRELRIKTSSMRMEYDDAAWERSDNVFDDFKKVVVSRDVLLAVTDFMASYRDWVRPVDRARIADLGAFNLCFRMVFEDGFFPCYVFHVRAEWCFQRKRSGMRLQLHPALLTELSAEPYCIKVS